MVMVMVMKTVGRPIRFRLSIHLKVEYGCFVLHHIIMLSCLLQREGEGLPFWRGGPDKAEGDSEGNGIVKCISSDFGWATMEQVGGLSCHLPFLFPSQVVW